MEIEILSTKKLNGCKIERIKEVYKGSEWFNITYYRVTDKNGKLHKQEFTNRNLAKAFVESDCFSFD